LIEITVNTLLSIMFLCATALFVFWGLWIKIKDDFTGIAIAVWIIGIIFFLPNLFLWGLIVVK